ncbi:MAG: Response regulator of zinc sigma-54-dependent two-component system [Acidobacteria bacterium]|nr:Response regulator of zinc sigma-54-dependent two-component system [Acidobacteriota bacterium]
MRSSFVGDSIAVRELRRQASAFANAPFPILISGETGTGKLELAILVHEKSQRAAAPFVDIHCANLNDTLFESTLFGHERGAFTDARERRPGFVSLAQGGTLLFDEIDCLAPGQQAKLLRFIDRGRYERVGGHETLVSRASLLFTTNRDIWSLRDADAFRGDLLERIAWGVLHIPPLRERPEDIGLLATLFLEEARVSMGISRLRWASSALRALRMHEWTGNVRELKRLAVVIAWRHTGGETVEEEAVHAVLGRNPFRSSGLQDAGPSGLAAQRRDAERQMISQALATTNGNRVHAARLLKIGRRTLQEKIARYGL